LVENFVVAIHVKIHVATKKHFGFAVTTSAGYPAGFAEVEKFIPSLVIVS
jgi:hypothetical protein